MATPHEARARQCIARIEAARHLNAFTWFDADALLAGARAADRAQADGQPAGLLSGMPVAVKDSIDTPPFPTTSGSRLLSDVPAREPAAVWARLAAQGALLLGKTNMDELGCGGSSRSPRFGAVDNPLLPGHTAGGSSGGSAAALAAGLAPLALGSDTSGSLRIPASFCGVAAFRPTTAGEPRRYPTQGIVPLTTVFDTPGPMARSVAELVRLHQAITGESVHAAAAPPRLALARRGLFDDMDAGIAAAVDRALAQWQAAGVRLVEIDLHELVAEAIELQKAVGGASRLADVLRVLDARGLGRPAQALIDAIQTPSVRRYFAPPPPGAVAAVPALLARLDALAAELATRLRAAGTPLFVYPTTRHPPARLDAGDGVLDTNYYGDNARLAPALGIPACGFVCARDAHGRPVAGANLEVAGPRGADADVLAASLWLERWPTGI